MAKRTEELRTVPHYIDGKTFSFHVPYNLDDLDCKLDPKAHYNELPWSPWPNKKGIERRVGNFVLKLHDSLFYSKGYGKSAQKIPHKLIRLLDDPEGWTIYYDTWDDNDFVKKTGYRSFFGRHVLTVLDEDFPELEGRHSRDPKTRQKERELRTPTPISKDILKKVYGRSHPRVNLSYTNYEFGDLGNQFQLDLEWYRKELLKIQRKRANKRKKAKAEELGITVADIEEQKRKERELTKQIQLTQEWIDISGEVHKCVEFLNAVVEQMGQRERLDREWYDKGRRHMRELANTMRPLNKHFPKKK